MLNGKDVIDCSSGGYTAGNYILVACGLCMECEMQWWQLKMEFRVRVLFCVPE